MHVKAQDKKRFSTIQDLVEETCKNSLDQVALEFEKRTTTFKTLSLYSTKVEHLLKEKCGAVEGNLIAIMMDPSDLQIMALLGVLKASCIFVPIDPNFPKNRVNYILNNSKSLVVITDGRLYHQLDEFNGHILQLRIDDNEIFQHEIRAGNLSNSLRLNRDIVYCYYTSGSTGMPKGVCGTHSGTINRFFWMYETYPFQLGDVCCYKTNITFVDSFWEIFGPLVQGQKIVIAPAAVRKNVNLLVEFLEEKQVTRLIVVPAVLRSILQLGRNLKINNWTSSGEPLTPDLLEKFFVSYPDATLLNIYGSTEVTADVTWAEFTKDSPLVVSIGKPITNNLVYILDENLDPVTEGELYVTGANVAAGYLNNVAETQLRFIANPFYTEGENPYYKIMFKTGDRGSINNNGDIVYLGRMDRQVKVNGKQLDCAILIRAGIRIELNEVENNIKNCSSALDAAVVTIAPNINSNVIAACVILRENASIADVKSYLTRQLPEYMIPQVWRELSSFPVNSSNKVDYLSIKNSFMENLKADSGTNNETEKKICAIIQEILDTEGSISTHEDLHIYGLDSLKLVVFLQKISEQFGVAVPLPLVATQPTVQKVAAIIHQQEVLGTANPDYTVIPLHERYAKEAIAILVDSFLQYEVLYQIIPMERSKMTNTIAKVVEQSIPQDLSLVAVDSNDKVLGVIINEDFTSGVSENYESEPEIAAVLNVLDLNYKKTREMRPNYIFHTFLLGTTETPLKASVATQLEMLSIDIAKQKQFKKILTTATHPFTIQLAHSLGYKLLDHLHLPSFEYNGTRPFSKIPVNASDTLNLFELDIE